MNQSTNSSNLSPRYRKMENMQIVFWLLKDLSWCMIWKALGVMMIVPTLYIAILLVWKTRDKLSEFNHNLAIVFWILANSYWMISQFFDFDDTVIMFGIEAEYLAVIPFSIGMLILFYYYAVLRHREPKAGMTLS